MRRRVTATPTGEPIVAEGHDVDTESYMVLPDGRAMERTVLGFSAEIIERMRQGYVCVKCYEAVNTAFPDECPVCKFPMREKQTEEFAKDFRGSIRFGPTTTLDEEYAIAQEQIQREAYDKARKLGLILPKYL